MQQIADWLKKLGMSCSDGRTPPAARTGAREASCAHFGLGFWGFNPDLERHEHELVILIEHERLGMILEVEVPLAFRVAHAALPRCRRGIWRVAAEGSNNSRALSLSVKLSAVKLVSTSA